MKVAIVGGSGYVGGELLRLLLGHPKAEVVQVTSDSMAGKPVTRAHPNLRGRTDLTFTPHAALGDSDATFIATPHGRSMTLVPPLIDAGRFVVDLSADFRLKDPSHYPAYYDRAHPRTDLLGASVYGLPELHREAIRHASLVANPGCIAAASILALRPLARGGLLSDAAVVVDAKSGSSAGGQDAGPAAAHPERAGVMRLYAPAQHRHTPEIEQETATRVALSCHAVDAVRGVLSTCHAPLKGPTTEKDLWKLYRAAYGEEPFVRIVHDAAGLYRQPEPKILAGTNYCDVGFAIDPHTSRVVAVAAIDNLGKGAAGNAVQCWNIHAGYPETTGLEFPGLHPI
jgi:LysW-gamma-L-alpha-aminoadipyl-6-phosphate/LysW-L-glutamyl-5-phosphate reductase